MDASSPAPSAPSFPGALAAWSRRSPWNSLRFLLPAWVLFLLAPPVLLPSFDAVSPGSPWPPAAARWLAFLLFLLWMPLYLLLARRPLSLLRPAFPGWRALPAVAASLALYFAAALLWNLVLAAFGVPLASRTSLSYVETALAAPRPVAALLLAYPLLAAPVLEEVFFRGAFLSWMAGIIPPAAPPRVLRTAAAIALLVPALVFAHLHAVPPQIPPLVLLALLLSRLAVRHGLPSAVLLHALCNLVTLAFLLLAARSSPA